ncbi:MAG: hypothetical protein Q4C95_07615 [Planctomycetia bacterium]|nr:hypothetical protein [Planctomycetia bacterium]
MIFRTFNNKFIYFLIIAFLFILGDNSNAQPNNQKGFSGYLLDSSNLIDNDSNQNLVDWSEQFEVPGISWRYLYREKNVEVSEHCRTTENFHSGRQSEKITFHFKNTDVVFLGHYIDYPQLSNQMSPSLWLRADRPGITIGMIVVLPKTLRMDTGLPLTLLIPGSTYSQVGDWEKLVFSNDIKKAVNESIQAIRWEHGITVDPEEAYVRQIVLLIEGRQGKYSLWIDDLEIMDHNPRPLQLLQDDERNSCFNPINLLEFRLAVTNESFFLGIDQNNPYQFGYEPFAIDQEKAEKRKKELERQKRFQRQLAILQQPSDSKLFQWNERPFQNSRLSINHSEDVRLTNTESAEFSTTDDLTQKQSITQVDYSAQEAQNAEIESPSPIVVGSGTISEKEGTAAQSFPKLTQDSIPVPVFKNKILTLIDQKSQNQEMKLENFGVRAIEYQGESLQFLKSLHFNAIWLKTPPSAALLKEADQAQIWLIAPPPIGEETVPDPNQLDSTVQEIKENVPPYFNRQKVSSVYDRVLLWNIGSDIRKNDYNNVCDRVSVIRLLDEDRKRPVICNTYNGIADYSYRNDVDALLIRRQPFLTSFNLTDYQKWLQNCINLATPGFPVWNEIQTQADPQLLAQCRFFGSVDELPSLISYEQMRQQMRLSMAANCHGLLFASSTPLDQTDHETQYRAAALELLNLELCLVNWWFAGGSFEQLISSNHSTLSAVVLRTDRAILLMPISTEFNNQYLFGQGSENKVKLIAPAQEGYSAELLVPGVLGKVPSERRAGGVHIKLEEMGMSSLIFLTQFDNYRQEIAEKAPLLGPRMAELAIRLAKMRLDTYEQTLYQLNYLKERDGIPIIQFSKRPLLEIREQNTLLAQTRQAIQQAEDYLRQKDDSQAYLQAERALREIRLNERRFWQTATRFEESLPVLPVSISFYLLPAYMDYYQRISGGKMLLVGDNKIQGGDMEDANSWNAGKWNAYEERITGVKSSLLRDKGAQHSGQFGLRIQNERTLANAPVEMECAPINVIVPCSVKTGELVCVQGWIKIPTEIETSGDGLMIYDDHGGPALAQRFKKTAQNDWQRFAFYRYAASDGEMKIQFSLNGYGQVFLDDIGVYTVQ